MRRLMKRVAAAVLMAACLLSLSACSAKQDEAGTAPRIATDGTPVDDMMAEYAKLTAVQSLGVSTDGLIAQKVMSEAQGNAVMAALCEEQINARKELGEVRSIDIEDASVVQMADGTYTVMLPVAFTEGSLQYVINLNMISQQIVDAEFTELASNEEEGKTIGQLMETATVYAVIGIGTVFAVLIFISLLIACFKFIHKWETGQKEKAAPAPAPVAPAPVKAAAPVPAAGEDLMGDAELVAVISAAIAAYEGTSSNGLVVRSIRRVQRSKGR